MQRFLISKNLIYTSVLFLLLTFMLRLFSNFEIKFYFIVEAIFYVAIIIITPFVFYVRRLRVHIFDLLVVFIGLTLVFYSAIRANLIFDQPVVVGVLAHRTSIFSIIIFLLFTLVINEKLKNNSKVVIDSMKTFSWFYLFLWTFLSFFLNPVDFLDTKLVDIRYTSGEYRFRFEEIPIVCGFYYYASAYLKERKAIQLFISSLFFLYLLFVFQGRASLLVCVTILSYFYIIDSVRKKRFHQLLMVGFIVIVSLPYFFSALGFDQIFKIIDGDYRGIRDASAMSRIEAFETIQLDLERYLFFGVGYLSHQFKNGYEYFYGYYFPADIGVVGATHIYGLILVVVYNTLIVFYYFYHKLYRGSFFLNMFFLYLFVLSFQNAQFMLVLGLPFILMNFLKVCKNGVE